MRPFTIRYKPWVAKRAEMKRFEPGEAAKEADFEPGDFILTHSNAFVSRIIRWGQSLRFWGKKSKYTWWNHAALIVSQQGDIIEALGAGVEKNKLSKYTPTEYTVVRIHSDLIAAGDRNEVVSFSEWALGQEYGYLTIISIALSLIFGGKFSFFIDGQSICSGLVARALERTKVIFDRSPSHIMPADLAFFFDVEPPQRGSSKGNIPR